MNTGIIKIWMVFAVILTTVSGKAQVTADIGIWGGTSSYIGDIDDAGYFKQFSPNFGAFYRYNFNSRVGLRAQVLAGNFKATGNLENVPDTFNKGVQDFSLQAEVNYLKYILGGKNTPFTSYVLAGLSLTSFKYEADTTTIGLANPLFQNPPILEEFTFSPAFAFGIGFKYTIGQRLGVGIEYQMRKLFSDKLDDLDDPLSYGVVKYTDALHNNDWTGYLGLHVTYKIYVGKKACPAYESKN